MKKLLLSYSLFLISILCLPKDLFSQNVGIGIANPLSKLHIAEGSSGTVPFPSSRLSVESDDHTYINLLCPSGFESGILFGKNGNAAEASIIYNYAQTPNGFQFRTNGSPNVIIDQAGNVGIGTSTPANKLQVQGTVSISGFVGLGTTIPGFPLNFSSLVGDKISLLGNTGAHYGFGIQNGVLQIHTADAGSDIIFGYGSSASFTENMRIRGNGNIGIGTNSPAVPLSFANITGKKISLYNGATGDAGFSVEPSLLRIYSDYNNADIAFGYDNYGDGFHERMRIKGNGNVGIGVDSSSARLEVRSFSSSPQLQLHQSSTGDFSRLRFKNDNSLINTRYWDIAGLTDASSISNDRLNFFCGGQGDILSLKGNGDAVLLGCLTATNVTCPSDIRLKRDIHRIENSLPKILQLSGYNYYWKEQNIDQSLQTGVLAQEVQKLFPELVKENEKGLLSVNYSGLIPVMIESIKEQQKQIDELKTMMKQLLGK